MTATFAPAIAPSKYQQAVYDFIKSGSGDARVNAVAGSGKTTTLVGAAKLIKGRGLFLAFNKHIADELGKRLVGTTMTASTIHSVGYKTVARAMGRLVVKEEKYYNLSKDYIVSTLTEAERYFLNSVPQTDSQREAKAKFEATIRLRVAAQSKLVDMARLTLTKLDDATGLGLLMARYDISLDDDEAEAKLIAGVKVIVHQGVTVAKQARVVDYTDMIFLPVYLNLPVDKFDWVMVDECQDLSACQRRFIQKLRGPGGRYILVGDEKQAIMGFAGADTASFHAIKAEMDTTDLPLSICYRCPASHLMLARQIVPQIEARPNAPAGTIRAIHARNAGQDIGEGALVLSRTTAPLVQLCIQLIRSRKPARVRGRDIAKGLIDIAKKTEKIGSDFLLALETYEQAQIERLSKKRGTENQIAVLQDKCAALRVCWNDFEDVKTVEDLCRAIDSIFTDARASIWLSTVHRAKGLEAENVYILNPKMMPLKHAKHTAEDKVQEMNLLYVALTRSTDSLTFIHGDDDTLPTTPEGNVNLGMVD